MSVDVNRTRVNPVAAEVELLRSFKSYAALRSSIDWRFPGAGTIGAFVPLAGLHGYTAQTARDIVDIATAGLGVHFTDRQIAAFGGCLSDRADMVDQAITRRLHDLYREGARHRPDATTHR